jgi:hypothetical protein
MPCPTHLPAGLFSPSQFNYGEGAPQKRSRLIFRGPGLIVQVREC